MTALKLRPQKGAGNADNTTPDQIEIKLDKATRFLIAKIKPLSIGANLWWSQTPELRPGGQSLLTGRLRPHAECHWTAPLLANRLATDSVKDTMACGGLSHQPPSLHSHTLFSGLKVGGRAGNVDSGTVGQTEGGLWGLIADTLSCPELRGQTADSIVRQQPPFFIRPPTPPCCHQWTDCVCVVAISVFTHSLGSMWWKQNVWKCSST